MSRELKFETLAAHAGQQDLNDAFGSRGVPIYKTTSYLFKNSKHAADLFGLRELGYINKPVMVKRGMANTIEELLMAAEYVMSGGNREVILCERGIRTFERITRNTLDLSAIPVVKKLSHLPIIVDPSHGTGLRDKVAPMSRAAVAAGCDGLIIEVHYDPDTALCDGAQSLYPDQFEALKDDLEKIAPIIGKHI